MKITHMSLQAIDVQDRNKLFVPLAKIMESIIYELAMTNKKEASAEHLLEIAELVKKATGITIDLSIHFVLEPNAWVTIDGLKTNYSIFKNMKQPNQEAVRFVENLAKKNGGSYDGWVDTKNSTVGGIFSHITFNMVMTTGLFSGKLTGGEAAAILLHELGHAYTSLEFLADVATNNHIVLDGLNKVIHEKNPTTKRIRLAKYQKDLETINNRKMTLPADDVMEYDDKEIAIVYFGEYAREYVSRQISTYLDVTSGERVADQFAVRHGAGKDLTSALGKITKTQFFFTAFFTVFDIVIGLLVVLGGIGALIDLMFYFIGLLIVAFHTHLNTYERTLKKRMTTVRRQMIENLKVIDDKHRDEILMAIEEFEAVEKSIDGFYERDFAPTRELLASVLSPAYRKRKKSEQLFDKIEGLMNGDLFISAAKLKTI